MIPLIVALVEGGCGLLGLDLTLPNEAPESWPNLKNRAFFPHSH